MNAPIIIDTDSGEIVSSIAWDSVAQKVNLVTLRDPSRSYGKRMLVRREPLCVVYWAEETTGRAVYVGATASGCKLRGRVREHIQRKTRFGQWLLLNPDAVLHFVPMPDRTTAFRIERELIVRKQPVLNER